LPYEADLTVEEAVMTAPTRSRSDHPISMRLPEADIALIDRAATVRAAEDALLDHRLIRMSEAGFDAFLAALAEPAAPAPEMVEALRRPAPWEPGSAPKD
jgi:uncharacterized protein (DUF1778 family)